MVYLKFPEIKRAKPPLRFRYGKDYPKYFQLGEIRRERRSRAEWAEKIAEGLDEEIVLGSLPEDSLTAILAKELRRQAKEDSV